MSMPGQKIPQDQTIPQDRKIAAELGLTDTLAVARTRMASERTLMGWVRTAISMITFGFTMARALQFAVEEGVLKGIRAYATENVALILIILGTVSLAIASYQHWRFVQALPAGGAGLRRWDLTLTMASLIVLLGSLILVNVLFRVGPI
jgi:inner membrane protein YidH